MKNSLIIKKLSGSINEKRIYNNNFVCLVSQTIGKIQHTNGITAHVQKITQINSKRQEDLLKGGLPKNIIFKSFNTKSEFIAFIMQKDKHVCFSFIKYQSFFIEFPETNLNS